MKQDSERRPPYFALSEYEEPGRTFVQDGIDLIMRLKDPVYRLLQVRKVERVLPTKVPLSAGGEFVTEPLQGATAFTMPGRAVVGGRYRELVEALAESADKRLAEIMPQFFKAMDDFTTAAEQVVKAGGTPLSHELVLEMLNKLEIDFDDHGAPQWPQIIGGPKAAESWVKLGPRTLEQQRAFDQLVERKYGEFLARKRYRRLPR